MEADAVVVGNHEFDKGADNLAEQAEAFVTYPFLAANYIFKDWSNRANNKLGKVLFPYTVLNVHGLRVAIIGMGDTSSMLSITQGGNSLGITPVENNETLRSYVELLSPMADLIVVLSHLGLDEDQELTSGHATYLTADKNVDTFRE